MLKFTDFSFFLCFCLGFCRDVSAIIHHLSVCLSIVAWYLVVKQRMQMFGSPYKNVSDCIRSILRTEGIHALYRSYTTQLTMNIPFQSIHFVTYELGQEVFNPERRYNPGTHVVSGAAAGAVAAAITTPLDVCKTLLNTQDKYVVSQRNGVAITGMITAFRTIYRLVGQRLF